MFGKKSKARIKELEAKVKELEEEVKKQTRALNATGKFAYRESDLFHGQKVYIAEASKLERMVVECNDKWATVIPDYDSKGDVRSTQITKSGWLSKTELLKYMKNGHYRLD